MYFLKRIREVRKERGYSQEKIAKKIGMEQTQYSRYGCSNKDPHKKHAAATLIRSSDAGLYCAY